jgi:hypothetical protein
LHDAPDEDATADVPGLTSGAGAAATAPAAPSGQGGTPGATPSVPSALGLPERAAVPAAPPQARGGQHTAPAVGDAAPSTPPSPRRREAATARTQAEADASQPSQAALLASLPPTPLAACVSLAKSALERCLREQCGKAAWRSHALCRQASPPSE